MQVYGVLYLGVDLNTAVMESVFHKHQWSRATRPCRPIRVSSQSTAGAPQDRLPCAAMVQSDVDHYRAGARS